ncbi:MAG: hypothetical protein ACOC2W_01065 [bacterium]
MINFVFAYESYLDECPVHSTGIFCSLKKSETIEDILNFAVNNINVFSVIEIVSLNDENEYELEYIPENHKYKGINFYVNGIKKKYTYDYGDGNLIWKESE